MERWHAYIFLFITEWSFLVVLLHISILHRAQEIYQTLCLGRNIEMIHHHFISNFDCPVPCRVQLLLYACLCSALHWLAFINTVNKWNFRFLPRTIMNICFICSHTNAQIFCSALASQGVHYVQQDVSQLGFYIFQHWRSLGCSKLMSHLGLGVVCLLYRAHG